ncbi:MAG: polysaccharide biosynthesis/export family protein [Verrucomicrobiota bacterium]
MMRWAVPHFLLYVGLLAFSGCQHVRVNLPDIGSNKALGSREIFDPRDLNDSLLDEEAFELLQPERELDPKWLEPSLKAYRVGVGDWLEIEITGIGGSRSETFVMPDGRVYYDLAGGVRVDGLTIAEISDRLKDALSKDYSSPSVNVTLREVKSRRAWLLGRLNKPGLYPLNQPTTLLEGISLAGGLFTSRFSGSTEELADLDNSFVLRDGKVLPVDLLALIKQGDMSQNIYLEDGDYVYLPSSLSQNIHILGAVMQPQALGYKDKINLVAAIAHAKGPTPDANLDKVLIIRGSLSSPKVAVVDLKGILAGRVTNVELKPFDIVWVPDRPFKILERYFWVIFDAAATTIAVREGANSVETLDGESPDVVIPIGL